MDRRWKRAKLIAARAMGRLRHERRAATAVEYGLIVSLIVISMLAAFSSVASVTTNMWNGVSDKVTTSR